MRLLDPIDLKSATWEKIRVYLEDRKAALTRENENLELPDRETTALRARLLEVKALLKLGEVRDTKMRVNIEGGDEIIPPRIELM